MFACLCLWLLEAVVLSLYISCQRSSSSVKSWIFHFFIGRFLWMLFLLDQMVFSVLKMLCLCLWLCLWLCLCLCLCLCGSFCAIPPKTNCRGGGCSAEPVFSLLKMLCLQYVIGCVCVCGALFVTWSCCSDGGCSAKPDCSKEQDGRCSCKLTVTCNKED